MVFIVGLCCVAWTIVELVRLSHATPSLVGSPEKTRRTMPGASARRRMPLAAWDEQGRPIFVEDVALRGRH